jgi:hypothetical protein
LEKLNKDLDSVMTKKWSTIPTVRDVLAILAKAMGLVKQNNDYNDNVEFVSGMLK